MMKTARQAPPPASMREASGWTSAVSPGEIADLPNIPGLELIFGFEAERPRRAEHHGREAQTGYVLSSLNVIFVGQVAHEGADGKARIEYPLPVDRSEEHTSELQSLMRISHAVLCWKKTKLKSSH